MKPTFWTEPRETSARKLFEAGASASVAASELSHEFRLDITRNAIIGLWRRRQWTGRAPKVTSTGSKRENYRKAKRERTMIIRANNVGSLRVVTTIDAPLKPLRIADATPLHIGLQDLASDTCRYPYGDGPFTFCGCAPVPGRPYCEPHEALCFNAPTAERRAETEQRKRAHMRSQRATA